jgi:hypothetical protein
LLTFHRLTATLLLLAGLIAAPASVRAAQSYDNCTGFIDTLPATITTQGTWCLRHDLSTAVTSGNAITIATNNVTIDCNDFKLGGLAAGAGTQTIGIYAAARLNTTVRHCNIRGFFYGVLFSGSDGGGHVIEDNRFDGNSYVGLWVQGDGSAVRRNQVTDTGGSSAQTGSAYGVQTGYAVDVLDNTVSGVLPSANGSGNGTAYGIYTSSNLNGSVSGNRVRGLVQLGIGTVRAIWNNNSSRVALEGNHVVGDSSAGSIGLRCSTASGSTRANIISGFETAVDNCTTNSNMIVP